MDVQNTKSYGLRITYKLQFVISSFFFIFVGVMIVNSSIPNDSKMSISFEVSQSNQFTE